MRRSSDIPAESYSKIILFVEFLKKNPKYKVVIVGHTDNVGESGDNMILSYDRSHSLKSALIREGINKDRIIAVGRGELDPQETNRTVEGRAMNRIIEIKLLDYTYRIR